MDFAEKLTAMMKIAGLTNGRIAKHLDIHPSLVSRWRGGSRQPVPNSTLLVQLSACIASQITTSAHRAMLAQYFDDPTIAAKGRQEITEMLFAWFNEGEAQLDFVGEEIRLVETGQPQQVPGNAFAGERGRQHVLRQLFERFDSTRPSQTVLFYSSDSISWLEADVAYRSGILEQNPFLLDNVSAVKLLVRNNASIDEYIGVLRYVLPFFENGTIQIACLPKFRQPIFSNTILIAGGSVAAASHGFAGSGNFMTNLYTDEWFIQKLTQDFNHLFAQCQRVHTIEQDIEFYSIMEMEIGMFKGDVDMVYLGNALPCALMPERLLLQSLGNGQSDYIREDRQLVKRYIKFFEAFLCNHRMYILMPLYRPDEIAQGAAVLAGYSQGVRMPLDMRGYLSVLRHAYGLMQKHPGLYLRFLEPRFHSFALMIQRNTRIYGLKNKAPYTLYQFDLAALVQAFTKYLTERFGVLQPDEEDRFVQMERLRAHIELLEVRVPS